MSEAVRTMASSAAIWTIVVIATSLTLFMATAAYFMDLRVARTQRRERMLGIEPAAGSALAMAAGSQWPRLGEALQAAAEDRDVPWAAALHPAAGSAARAPAAVAATRHDIPAQRSRPAQRPEPARQPAAARYAGAAEAEAPTEPIPAPSAQGVQGMRDASGGRHSGADDGATGEMPTRPDLPTQQAPGQPAVPMPAQRTGESDRAERSLAGPAPQDEDEDEQ